MRPIILEISGLNSYIKAQRIDFSRLTARGLFGITGPIGSGKSTVLDAITLALYSKTERGRKSCVNVESEKAEIRFTFEIGGKPRLRYCIEKTFKRNNDGGVNVVKARLLLEDNDGGYTVLEDKAKSIDEAVVKILGLTYDDFTRSVVLPQGKFSEFLTLPKKDRNTMLERIFSLEEYGNRLRERLKLRYDDARIELRGLQSALSAYQDVSNESLERLTQKQSEYAVEIEALQKTLEETNRIYSEKKKTWERHLEYNGYLETQNALLKNSEAIKAKETALSKGQQADFLLPFIKSQQELTEQYEVANKQYTKTQEKAAILQDRVILAKSEYDAVIEQKRTDYEPLLQRKIELNDAVSMAEEATVILQQRNKLRDSYTELAKAADSDRNELNCLLEKKESFEHELQKLTEEKRLLQVAPEMRAEASDGLRAEEEMTAAANRLRVLRERIANGACIYDETSAKLETAKQRASELHAEQDTKTREQEALTERLPATTDAMLKMQQQISAVKNMHKNAVEHQDKIAQMSSRIAGLEELLTGLSVKLKDAEISQKASEDAISRLRQDKENLEKLNLASLLSATLADGQPCPVCGAEQHPSPAKTIAESLLFALDNKISDAEEQNAKYIETIQELKITVAAHERQKDNEAAQLAVMRDELKSITNGESTDCIAERLVAMEKDFTETGKRVEKWESDRKRIAEEIHVLNVDYNRCQGDVIKFTESISKTTELMEALKAEETATEKQYEDYARRFEALRKKWGVESFEPMQLDIREKDVKRPILEAREQQMYDALAKNEKSRNALAEKLNAAATEIEQIKTTGVEKTARYTELQNKIERVSEGKNPTVYLAEVEEKLAALLNSEKAVENTLTTVQKELAEEQAVQIRLQKQTEILSEQRETAACKCADELRLAGFTSADEVKLLYIPAIRQKELKNEITAYADKLKEVESNITRVSALISGRQATEEEVLSLAEDIKLRAQQMQSVVEARAVNAAAIQRMQEDLAASEALLTREKHARHEFELLQQLKTLFEGNAFIEYISRHELRYITAEASRRLKSVTHGRYGLEFDGEDFVMRDDAWGGKRRPVTSLSGGELFLTSLSLALALSSKIQLKSAVLEFFFLDEGFGSLDSATLEVVMDSLEQLKNETLCVGLITHVEELKNRLPIRLEISPAADGTGATVSIEV